VKTRAEICQSLARSEEFGKYSANIERPSEMEEVIFVVEEAPEGGYAACALHAPIFTETDALAELPDQVRDAVRCHFDEGQAPRVINQLSALGDTVPEVSPFEADR